MGTMATSRGGAGGRGSGSEWVRSMVDAAGTNKYAYTSGGQLWTEDGPFASDTVTNAYLNRMRVSLALHPGRYQGAPQPRAVLRTLPKPPPRTMSRLSHGVNQPAGLWTNGLGYDAAERFTNVASLAGSHANPRPFPTEAVPG